MNINLWHCVVPDGVQADWWAGTWELDVCLCGIGSRNQSVYICVCVHANGKKVTLCVLTRMCMFVYMCIRGMYVYVLGSDVYPCCYNS